MGYGIKRGDIFYISKTPVIGHEQFSGRPAIVVSCNANNKHCETVEIVYLTTQPKTDLPTHVMIRSARFQSTALCEQVTTVSTSRLGDYYGSCTQEEMEKVDTAIMCRLDYASVMPVKWSRANMKYPKQRRRAPKAATRPLQSWKPSETPTEPCMSRYCLR